MERNRQIAKAIYLITGEIFTRRNSKKVKSICLYIVFIIILYIEVCHTSRNILQILQKGAGSNQLPFGFIDTKLKGVQAKIPLAEGKKVECQQNKTEKGNSYETVDYLQQGRRIP